MYKLIYFITFLFIIFGSTARANTVELKNKQICARFDTGNGDLLFLGAPNSPDQLVHTQNDKGFWSVTFENGEQLTNRQFGTTEVSYRKTDTDHLVFLYRKKGNEIELHLSISNNLLDCKLIFLQLTQNIKEVALPANLSFQPATINNVIYPSELGLKLNASFYLQKEKARVWNMRMTGSQPFSDIAGIECQVLPVTVPQDRVSINPAFRQMLGETISNLWESDVRLVARPSVTQPDYNIINSGKGSFLGGHRIKNGTLFRFGGKIRLAESSLTVQTTSRILVSVLNGEEHFACRPVNRKKVILLALEGCPNSTGWNETSIEQWSRELSSASELTGRVQITTVKSIAEMKAAFTDPAALAIINPYGESFPFAEEDVKSITDAIRSYISNGGIWFESGGYPFFNTLYPARYNSLHDTYPFAFSDFFKIESKNGNIAFYGIQDCRKTGLIFVPLQWNTFGDKDGGHISRKWRIYIDKKQGGETPLLRFNINQTTENQIASYRTENGFNKKLEQKMPAGTLETWKKAVLMKYSGGTLKEQEQRIAEFPQPSVVHVWDYLKGGFDKEYPTHLPPHPSKGTMEDFTNLIKTTHQYGHLFMPYTNNTWWCDGPKSDFFKEKGDAGLFRDREGKPNREDYGDNYGWSICPWHPEVIESGKQIAKMFSDLGSDILFEDQVGAREWMGFDFNVASPVPHSYQQGIINLSADAAAFRPLMTEQGFDRLINVQTEFAGLTWRLVPFDHVPWWLSWWLKTFRDVLPQEDYEAFPLAQMVANGNTFFTHHLGGPLVTTSENLGWTLALGYQIIADVTPASFNNPKQKEWFGFLSQIQQHIGYYYMGQPIRSFRYLEGSGNTGVIESVFNDVKIIANHQTKPYVYKNVIIAPKGFYAEAGKTKAGYLIKYNKTVFNSPSYVIDRGEGTINCFNF